MGCQVTSLTDKGVPVDLEHPTVLRQPAVFIVGMPDSGVEELRLMLDTHPVVAVTGPTFFVPAVLGLLDNEPDSHDSFISTVLNAVTWRDHHLSAERMREEIRRLVPFKVDSALRMFYGLYAARFGKVRWGDGTNMYGYYMGEMAERLPEAHFIHIIRDGRDALVLARRSHGWKTFGTLTNHATEWCNRISTFTNRARSCPHYMTVRYEDLMCHTSSVLMQICRFINLDYDPIMLSYHLRAPARINELEGLTRRYGYISKTERLQGTYADILTNRPTLERIGRWRAELQPSEIKEYQSIAGGLLDKLGYKMY